MKKNKNFIIKTLGCKLNYSESSHISRNLSETGFMLSNENPAYIIVNTCAVTTAAEKKGRNLIAKLHRQYPDAQIIVIGCYTSLHQDLAERKGVVKIFGSEDKINILNYLKEEKIPPAPTFFSAFSSHDRTRSFLKIQDGCDYHCTYCTVARARGSSRSDTVAQVLNNICQIAQLGMKEVNLTGVNVGDFGRKNGEPFFYLLQQIEKAKLIERVRISSIEPDLLSTEIIDLIADSKQFMPHFHLPLQSGSDRILSLMKRKYNRELFEKKVNCIKSKMPHSCIAVDVISGFPSETERDFLETLSFLHQLPLSYLHVFTYSQRPHTPAAMMSQQVHEADKKERTKELLSLSKTKKELFYQQHIGQVRPVLFESQRCKKQIFGFTDNYIKVKKTYSSELENQIISITLKEKNLEYNISE